MSQTVTILVLFQINQPHSNIETCGTTPPWQLINLYVNPSDGWSTYVCLLSFWHTARDHPYYINIESLFVHPIYCIIYSSNWTTIDSCDPPEKSMYLPHLFFLKETVLLLSWRFPGEWIFPYSCVCVLYGLMYACVRAFMRVHWRV